VLAWHGIFTAVGVLAGIYFAAWLAPRAGITADNVWDSAWWVVIAGVVGARLLYAAEHPRPFVESPLSIFLLNEGGISVFGAVIGGMIGGAIHARRAGIRPARLLDVIAPGFLLGQAIGRIGDIINGEHLGRHAEGLPWAVVYTNPNTLGEIGVPVHPAVAYELIWDLVCAIAVAWLLRRRRLPPGVALCASFFLYSLGRLWVGFYRLDQHVALGLGLAQLIGLVSLPVAALGFWLALRQRPASSAPPLPPAEHATPAA
jgi:phosphatidylglycerol:prolipoprotein diacylglycerol transferase